MMYQGYHHISQKVHSNKALCPSLQVKKRETKNIKALSRIGLYNFFQAFTVAFCTLIQTMWLLQTSRITFDQNLFLFTVVFCISFPISI